MSLQELFENLKGGSGSGNFGHAGVPGHQGGSAPGGGGGSHPLSPSGAPTTGPEDVLNVVSQPSHPMYRAYMRGGTNFQSEDSARVNFGSGRRSGQYLLTREGNKFQVNGQPQGTPKKLLKKFNSVPEALEAMEDHFAGQTFKRIETGSPEWFKKYPETKPLRD